LQPDTNCSATGASAASSAARRVFTESLSKDAIFIFGR
jgi:hypothetical protein